MTDDHARSRRPARPASADADGFGPLLRAEWTKFRTVRGWVIAMILAALLTVVLGAVRRRNGSTSCQTSAGRRNRPGLPAAPPARAGRRGGHRQLLLRAPAADRQRQHHRPGDLADRPLRRRQRSASERPGRGHCSPGSSRGPRPGSSSRQPPQQGSAYAAMMVTGGHGVRMQYNYTHDTPGLPGAVSAASPRWLRLTRSGDTITGYDSADGTHWTKVGTAQPDRAARHRPGRAVRHLAGLHVVTQSFGGGSSGGGPSQATGGLRPRQPAGRPGRHRGTAASSAASRRARCPAGAQRRSSRPAAGSR